MVPNSIFEYTYNDRLFKENNRLMISMEKYIHIVIQKELKIIDEILMKNKEKLKIFSTSLWNIIKEGYNEKIKKALLTLLKNSFQENQVDIQQNFITKLYPECFLCDHNWDTNPNKNINAPNNAEIIIFPNLTIFQKLCLKIHKSLLNYSNKINYNKLKILNISNIIEGNCKNKKETTKPDNSVKNKDVKHTNNTKLGPFIDDSFSSNKLISVYFGYYKNGLKNGIGKLMNQNSLYIEGNWKENKPNGKFKIINKNGMLFKGDIDKNYASGKIYSNKKLLDNSKLKNKKDKGYIFYKNGYFYKGNILNSIFNRIKKWIWRIIYTKWYNL